MPGSVAIQDPGGQAAPQESGLEVVAQTPRTPEGFLLHGRDAIPSALPDTAVTDVCRAEGTARLDGKDAKWSGHVALNPIYAGRLILGMGWTGMRELYDEFTLRMAERGVTTLVFDTIRINGLEAFSPASFRHAWQQQAEATLAVEEDTRKIGGNDSPDNHIKGGHSGAGEGALDATSQDPDATDYVLLIGSAGQVSHGWGGLLSQHIVPSFLPHEGFKAGANMLRNNPAQAGRYLLNTVTHPWEALGEGVRAGSCDIVSSLEKIANHNIPVVNMLLDQDNIFPSEDVVRHLDKRAQAHMSRVLGHLAPNERPDELADEIIELHPQVIELRNSVATASAA